MYSSSSTILYRSVQWKIRTMGLTSDSVHSGIIWQVMGWTLFFKKGFSSLILWQWCGELSRLLDVETIKAIQQKNIHFIYEQHSIFLFLSNKTSALCYVSQLTQLCCSTHSLSFMFCHPHGCRGGRSTQNLHLIMEPQFQITPVQVKSLHLKSYLKGDYTDFNFKAWDIETLCQVL